VGGFFDAFGDHRDAFQSGDLFVAAREVAGQDDAGTAGAEFDDLEGEGFAVVLVGFGVRLVRVAVGSQHIVRPRTASWNRW
jgi:hypothetical protein